MLRTWAPLEAVPIEAVPLEAVVESWTGIGGASLDRLMAPM
jgi:hypothetical protein